MKTAPRLLRLSALVFAMGTLQSCSPHSVPSGSYKIDTVRFVLSNHGSSGTQPAPGIWIDTNMKLRGFLGGTVKSSKPYGIAFDYTDNTFTFKTLEFSTVRLTYDDGMVEPSVKGLALPLRISVRKYETVNSVSGGGTVKAMTHILSGKIPGIVHRDEPFTLQIMGHFTKEDGTKVAFTIDQHYEIEKESTTRAAADVLQDK